MKATMVAYAFSVQCYKHTTIVTYVGLKVKFHKFAVLVT